MYEKDNKANYLKIAIRIILFLLIFLLTIKLISSLATKHNDSKKDDVFNNNLNYIQESARKYFVDDKIPSNVGDENKVTLDKLKEDGIIDEIKDEHGNTCNMEASYISIYNLDSEYQIKSYLVCDDQNNFQIEYIDKDTGNVIENNNSTTTTIEEIRPSDTTKVQKTTRITSKKTTKINKNNNSKKTTKKINKTSNKIYKTISFYTNGGDLINDIKVLYGTNLVLPTPVRKGYVFGGWFYHNKRVNSLNNVTSDMVLVAQWSKIN